MKILITTDWYSPVVNGVVTSVLNLKKELEARGHEVRILTLSQKLSTYEDENVTYIRSISAGRIYPGARIRATLATSAIRDLVAWQPNVIHSQCEFSTFFMAKYIARELNIPLVHTYHTVYEDYTHYLMPNKKWGKRIVATLSRHLTRYTYTIIAPTEKVRNILCSYGIDTNVCVLPTGIELDKFANELADGRRAELRDGLNIPEGNRILLYIGRIAKEKNLDEILEYHAKCEIADLTFVIVGDGPYRAELEKNVEKMGLSEKVRFAGMVSPKLVQEYYRLGDLFVSASVSETQGLTYIEALASALPTLCRRDDCLDGIIINGENGWQFESGEDYMQRLTEYFSNSENRTILGKNAFEYAQKTFSSQIFAKNAEQIYFDAIERYR